MDLNVISLFLQATLVVKGIMLLLVFFSLTSWGVIIAKLVSLSSAKAKIAQGTERFDNARDLRQAVQSLGGDPASPLYAVAQEGVLEFNRSREVSAPDEVVVDNVRRSLHQGVNMEVTRLNHSLSILATCANTAPFIGLFGTVWGIMHSFNAIGRMNSVSLATVAPGISEALIATAIGLGVAIPATIAYNSFLGKVNVLETMLVNFAGGFLNRVQREITGQASPATRSTASSTPSATGTR